MYIIHRNALWTYKKRRHITRNLRKAYLSSVMKKNQPVWNSFSKKLKYYVQLQDWNALTLTNMSSLFSFIVFFGLIAPLDITDGLSGERTAWTSKSFLWFVAWNFFHTFCRMTVFLFSRYWKVPLREFTGCHQRLSNVHMLAFSLPQLAACVSIVEVHFDDQRFLWEEVGWET